ncbi:MAG: hypothetical protein J6P83_03975 [Bacteroidales bacterium]|nr:hypothetical protein [Bacteroidales bacterium]
MVVSAQVSFSARVYVFLPTNEKPLDHNFLVFPACLKVDGEDSVRYQYDTTATICFNDIAIGSRCHFYYCEFETLYDYPVFTITADTHIDSLVLRPIPKKEEMFWTKAQKDSTLFSRATRWSHDLKGHDTLWYDRDEVWLDKESRSLKLARLYYTDWVAPFASWRTWPHAADSAYRYCLHAYKQYPFLYYPLRQLAQHLGKTAEIIPPKEPDEYTYLPQPIMPEEWWADTTADLFTLWEKHYQENAYAHDFTLGIADEKSLCYPIAPDGTMRLIIIDPLGYGVLIYRIEGDRIYHKRISAYDDELKDNEYFTLTDEELDTVVTAVEAFHHAGLADDKIVRVIDGCTFELEYIINGHYHHYINYSGIAPPQLENLMELMRRIYKRKLPSFIPIQVTSIVPNNEFQCSFATVYSCLRDTLTIGYLLVPKEDESSMESFNKSVSKDLWGDAVGVSPKRYVPDLVDVQQAESVLAEVMRDGVLPQMGPYYRNIGNLENYTKYERTYGFYYNEKEEKCVYIQMELLEPFPRLSVGFMKFWDSCDYNVYINLNLEKHEVIRAYPSTCQGY